MADTVIVEEAAPIDTGYKFSWGLAFAGGVTTIAVTFFLLSLGAGLGLLLINPATHQGPSVPTLLTGGAIYFLAASAFGYAVGGHVAGRLLGPVPETDRQEETRAALHGVVSWAVATLGTIGIVAVTAGAAGGAATLYGAAGPAKDTSAATAYQVDQLFRPATGGAASATDKSNGAREEAGRLISVGMASAGGLVNEDKQRLIDLTAAESGVSADVAKTRVETLQQKQADAANTARKAASYGSLWLALALMFGAIVSAAAAWFARYEDDKETARGIRTRPALV